MRRTERSASEPGGGRSACSRCCRREGSNIQPEPGWVQQLGPSQEGRHLVTEHRAGGTESVDGTSSGDPGFGQQVDLGFELRSLVIGEPVRSGGGVAVGPDQEGSHLLPGDDGVRAEDPDVAAAGDPGGGEAVDLILEDRSGVVGEVVAIRGRKSRALVRKAAIWPRVTA